MTKETAAFEEAYCFITLSHLIKIFNDYPNENGSTITAVLSEKNTFLELPSSSFVNNQATKFLTWQSSTVLLVLSRRDRVNVNN